MKTTDWSSVPRQKRPLTNGPYRPKSGSRARSDRGLTVDGDRTQGSSVEVKAMLEKIHRICTRQQVTVKVETFLFWWQRKNTNASNRSRSSYKNYVITSAVGYFGFVVVML
jgi:hypothetical protein